MLRSEAGASLTSAAAEMKATVEIAIGAYFRMEEGGREFLKTAYEDGKEEKLP